MNIKEVQAITGDILKNVTRICEEEKLPYIAVFGSMLGAIRHSGPIPWDYDVDLAVPVDEIKRFNEVMEKRLPEKYWIIYRNENEAQRPILRIGLRGYKTDVLHVDVFPAFGVPEDRKKEVRLYREMSLLMSFRAAKEYTHYKGKKAVQAKLIKIGLFFLPQKVMLKRFDRLCTKYPYAESKYFAVGGFRYGYKKKIHHVKSYMDDTILVDYDDFKIRVSREYDAFLKEIYHDYMKFPPEQEQRKGYEADYPVRKING